MLKMVLYAGFRCFIRNVHCDHALAVARSTVGAGPSSRSAVKATA